MKRVNESSIASLFAKRVSKESENTSNPNSLPTQQSKLQLNNVPSSSTNPPQNEEHETETTSPMNIERLNEVDVMNLPQDPGKRKRLSEFHVNDQDIVRREYCSRILCQPEDHDFPYTMFGTKRRRFNPKWFGKYKSWLEYSVSKDAAFCFACYLFKDDNIGKDAFVNDGFRDWRKPRSFNLHVGSNMSAHRNAMISLANFKNQKCSISLALNKQDEETKNKYRTRLEASIKCMRWLLLQGLPARGHNEKTKDLLIYMSCFHPCDRFSSFETRKLLELAKFYPNEFPNEDLIFFEESLQSFIDDVRNDERFSNVKNLNELSIKLVETKKHESHQDVYLLLKLVLLLPVATASVERSFSGMNYIKNKVRNSMGDQLLNDNLVTYLEYDVFRDVSLDAIVQRYQNMRTRREQL
ncbi:unnamed protein product [Amaranthus hypochondriacus]